MSLFDQPHRVPNYVCTLCAGSGIVTAKLTTKPIYVPFIFLCRCGSEDPRKRNFPTWPPENVGDYQIIHMEKKR